MRAAYFLCGTAKHRDQGFWIVSMEKYNHIIKKMADTLFLAGGELEQESYKWILKNCLIARAASIEVIDSGFDISSFGNIESGPIDTSAFKTIQDFFDYPTGQSIPTFERRSGMRAETWGERFIEYVRDYRWDWIAKSDFYSEIFDERGDVDDDFHDELCVSEVDEYYFAERFGEKIFPEFKLVAC